MPGHSRPKDGVASLAYVPGIHVFAASMETAFREAIYAVARGVDDE